MESSFRAIRQMPKAGFQIKGYRFAKAKLTPFSGMTDVTGLARIQFTRRRRVEASLVTSNGFGQFYDAIQVMGKTLNSEQKGIENGQEVVFP